MTLSKANNNRDYGTMTDEEVIASCSSKNNTDKNRETNDEEGQLEKMMNHAEAMVYLDKT